MCVLLLVLPRRLSLLPIVVTTCYMTMGQQLVVAGLHFTVLRLLVLIAYARAVVRKEFRFFRWLRIDMILVLWGLSSIVMFTFLWHTPLAVVNRLGVVLDTVGLYFIFRALFHDIGDLIRVSAFFPV